MSKAQSQLYERQKWFAQQLIEFTDSSESYVTVHHNMEIYHKQYWNRLLTVLLNHFPFLTRLFGIFAFNEQIAIPYLKKYPPSHFLLAYLGKTLPVYLETNYHKDDKTLVCAAALIDTACQNAFCSKHRIPDLTNMEQRKITLQSHISLFHFQADLFSYREKLLEQDVEYWNDHPFPDLEPGPHYVVLYRNLNNMVKWKECSQEEYLLLERFKVGATLDEACGVLQHTEEEMVVLWFREWALLQWLI